MIAVLRGCAAARAWRASPPCAVPGEAFRASPTPEFPRKTGSWPGFSFAVCAGFHSSRQPSSDTLASPRENENGHGRRRIEPLRDRDRPLPPLARGAHAVGPRVPRLAGIERPTRRPAVDPLLRPAREPEQGAAHARLPRGVLAGQVRAHQRALLLDLQGAPAALRRGPHDDVPDRDLPRPERGAVPEAPVGRDALPRRVDHAAEEHADRVEQDPAEHQLRRRHEEVAQGARGHEEGLRARGPHAGPRTHGEREGRASGRGRAGGSARRGATR